MGKTMRKGKGRLLWGTLPFNLLRRGGGMSRDEMGKREEERREGDSREIKEMNEKSEVRDGITAHEKTKSGRRG